MSLQPCRPPPALILVNEAPAHGAEIEALLDRAFGPGRFAKASERVREFAEFAPELSFCALEGGKVAGVVRMWRVAVGDQPIVFLGPLAVEESERRSGLGAMLVERACEASRAAGEAAVVLVGDLPYFQRVGFEVAPGVDLPGPVDPKRVLSRRFSDVALAGMVRPRTRSLRA
ncbi:MAG: N-acetyltransferase [Phenylobacterium sp.]|uniref:GNAT family N-acetyltransferase n=1 Tax=Phenylobacterium sp. TaxID=1871053 RepID=UPI001A4E8C8D|nr:N-acetyltransferase [Phenylobacterium sp.]MBL8773148.1 N-acetyltransferase [Phenylobacterium sp.]